MIIGLFEIASGDFCGETDQILGSIFTESSIRSSGARDTLYS